MYMTRAQRNVHVWVWVVLGPVVLAGVVAAVWGRVEVPRGASPQAAGVERAGGGR